jgi:hypothetical protein
MQIWEAIQEYMNRIVDFTEEVNIVDDGIGGLSVVWNIETKPAPTQEQLNALLPLQSPVTVFYDNNNFIWGRSRTFSNSGFTQYNSKIIHCDLAYSDTCVIVDPEHHLPHYRLINDSPSEITNMEDYSVDPVLWELYLAKVRIHVRYDLRNLSQEQNRLIYVDAPPYTQEIYRQEIDLKYAERIPQYSLNLVMEGVIKLLLSVLYIKDVEGRALTADEQAAYESMVTRFYDHSHIIQPFNGFNWSDFYQETVLTSLDGLRTLAIPERIYITGE